MNYLALALLLVFVSGCGRSPVDANDPLNVVLTTDKLIYPPQEFIYIQIENQTLDAVLVRNCIEIERRQEQQWESMGHLSDCQGTFDSVPVGSKFGRGTSLGDAYPGGVYRVANMVLLQGDWKQQERAVSNAFTITP